MGVVVLTSAAGAPGVTTTAVGLALCWPRSVLLIDADPIASQAVLAGFLRGRSVAGKGLVRVAEAHRERRPLREAVLDQCVELTTDESVRRLLLPGFTRPANAALFSAVWPDLALTLMRLDEVEIDVIVDAGRMEGRGLPHPLLEAGAQVGLVTRTTLRAVAATRTAATVLTDQSRLGSGEPPGLILVGSGQPYGQREIARALGCPVRGELDADARSAAVLSDGERRTRTFDRSALVRSLHALADRWCAELGAQAARVDGPGPFRPLAPVPSGERS